MSKEKLTQLASVNKQNSINFIKKDDKILFTAEEIGRQLGYKTPRQSINKLFQRNSIELLAYSCEVKLTSQPNQPTRIIRAFTEEGVYILSMLANTDQARDFRKRVAELLKNLRQKEMDRAFQVGFDSGRESGLKDMEAAKEISYQQGVDYGQSLPAVQIETKKFYLTGLEEGRKIQKKEDNWRKMEKAAMYLGRGLSLKDTAKLVHLRPGTIRERFQRLGLWERVKNGDLAETMLIKKLKKSASQPEQLSLL